MELQQCYSLYNNNCNLTTCRYNKSGTCTNEDKRKECVEVSEGDFGLSGFLKGEISPPVVEIASDEIRKNIKQKIMSDIWEEFQNMR